MVGINLRWGQQIRAPKRARDSLENYPTDEAKSTLALALGPIGAAREFAEKKNRRHFAGGFSLR
jgi:hypothetical protein